MRIKLISKAKFKNMLSMEAVEISEYTRSGTEYYNKDYDSFINASLTEFLGELLEYSNTNDIGYISSSGIIPMWVVECEV